MTQCYKTENAVNCVCNCPSFCRFPYILTPIIAFHLEKNPEVLPPFCRWENRFGNIGKLVPGHGTWLRQTEPVSAAISGATASPGSESERGRARQPAFSGCCWWQDSVDNFPTLTMSTFPNPSLLYFSGLRFDVLSNTAAARCRVKLFKFKLAQIK